jgi:hypothetical protein
MMLAISKQEHDRAQQPRRITAPQIERDAVTAHAADPGGDRLDHRHQRKAEQHRPGQPVAELGPTWL